MTTIGIDIGSYSVKVAEVEPSGKAYILRRFQNFPLSIDPNKDHEIEILDILRRLASEYDPASTRFVLGIDQKSISLRHRIFPFKERHKILKSLPFELEDDIPLAQEEALFDAKVINYHPHTSEIIALACPKAVVEKAIQLSDDCQFDLDIISVQGLALANLFENWYDPPPTTPEPQESSIIRPAELVLELGHQTVTMLVFLEGRLLEVRTFDWGGKNLAQALSKRYSLHLSESIRELEKKSFLLVNDDNATSDQIDFSQTLKDEIDELIQQLNLTLLELRSQHHLNFTKGLLTGGLSRLQNLSPYLTQKTEIPFKKFNVLIGNPFNEAATSEADGNISGSALGLAIEGLRKPKNPPLNLRKNEYAKKSRAFTQIVEKWSYTASVLAAAFFFFLIYGVVRENFAMQMAEQARESLSKHAVEIAGLKKSRANLRRTKDYIKKQKLIQKNYQLTEQLQSISSALDVLNQVTNQTPSGKVLKLNVKNFVVSNQTVRIEGEVAQKNSIPQIANALKNLAVDSQVNAIPSALATSKGWTPFGFRLRINRHSGASE